MENLSNLRKRNPRRGAKTASLQKEYKLCTNYDTMFSDTRPRSLMRMKQSEHEPVLTKPDLGQFKRMDDVRQMMEVQGSHRTLFYRQPSRKHFSSYSTVVVHLETGKGFTKKVTFGTGSEPSSSSDGIPKKKKPSMIITLPVESTKMIPKGVQTDYRESETQTLPWKHEIRAEGKVLEELAALDWFDLERNFPPGMEEVALIEKTRQKLAWENVLGRLRGKENELKRRSLVVRMTENEKAFKEARIDEDNRERIRLSREIMEKARENLENEIFLRLQRSYRLRRKENDLKIGYWNHQLMRNLRKIKSARERPPVGGMKQDIIAFHEDKTSELYAPKLRDGENPSRGHENIDIQCRYLKRYHGLKILERYLGDILQPKFDEFHREKSSKPGKIELCLRKHRKKDLDVEEEKPLTPLTLRIPVPPPTPETPAPGVERPRTDSEENLYQACLLLGKLVKGRAIQTKKFLEFYKMAADKSS